MACATERAAEAADCAAAIANCTASFIASDCACIIAFIWLIPSSSTTFTFMTGELLLFVLDLLLLLPSLLTSALGSSRATSSSGSHGCESSIASKQLCPSFLVLPALLELCDAIAAPCCVLRTSNHDSQCRSKKYKCVI